MRKRWQATNIRQALAQAPAVVLVGARRAGKTKLAKSFARNGSGHRDLEDPAQQQVAEEDPAGFVRQEGRLMVIDEAHRVPGVVSAVWAAADEDRRPGRYLLTVSAEDLPAPCVGELPDGLMRTIRVRPLSQGEVQERPPFFLSWAFDRLFRSREGEHSYLSAPGRVFMRDDCLLRAMRGGYPNALDIAGEADREAWHRDCLASLLEHDLAEVAGMRRRSAMAGLLSRLAAWSSRQIDVAKIGKGLGLSRETLDGYVSAAEAVCLIDRVPAWTANGDARTIRRDRLFMGDSGLMAAVLGWSHAQVRINGAFSDMLLCTLVHNQLVALVDAAGPGHEMRHYRDQSGRKVDFVVTNPDGGVLGINVSGAVLVKERDARHLRWFGENRVGQSRFTGLVLHVGGGVHRLAENVWGIPLPDLWRDERPASTVP